MESVASNVYHGTSWYIIDNGKKIMETTIVYWGYIGIMENKMEATVLDSFA